MSKTTRATQALQQTGVSFTVHAYDYDPNAERIGLQAAEALGADPSSVLKTLMVTVDGKPACAVVPSDREVNLKKLAAALGGKTAQMMKPADAERMTGYHVGGISPFGQKKRVPTLIEETALAHESVFINGGQRGLQVRLAPQDAARALDAKAVALV
ncbi:Cys-tRNA(Pro) deacylase [Microvirga subterranea]|uniref:Cys-tRNA(Pro)/Cys-tRNA(Cys) deacylase n=1 Tax=Microvirga subterranea TaxID=186651 RepID=A0A370HJJ1_9HYPH|nr:Cys-tRNA(Pro) deacylase [Microvirga subterranea]RDI58763.1 Cys-tRNA(Pro)/Cys-tRNA(Cys) deacylase [Microvirga subterranea]